MFCCLAARTLDDGELTPRAQVMAEALRRLGCEARGFVKLGFDTKEKLIAWCADNALLTAREYWDNQSIQLLRPKAVAGIEPYASRLKAQPDEVIRIYEPSDIHIVVAGGETQGAWKMISGALRATVSIDAWR